ncbi:hydrogen peroxide-inducible genes activator [Acidisoma sp. C75]
MNTSTLRYLLAIVDTGSFGRAAALCRVSQPTLSVQVRKLEETLGVTLLERHTRMVIPTPACHRILGHMRAAVAAADRILAEAQREQDPLAGRLRLGIIPTLAPYLLPLVFAPLRAAFPALAFEPWEEQTATLLRLLRAHELDAALLASDAEGSDLIARPLFTEGFLAALPPGHPLASRPHVAEEDLAPDILLLAEGHCLREQVVAACGGERGAASGALRAASLPTLLNMVAAGYGTTLIPALAARAAEDIGVMLRPLARHTQRQVSIVWRTHFPREAAIEGLGRVISGQVGAALAARAPAA